MDASPVSSDFYARLEPFTEFERFADFDAYAPVPDDWVVLAGDIEGSTQAIADGRYKAVNMVGAAVITAVLNVCREVDVPFVFGGDGGAVVVPASVAAEGAAALRRLQAHARANFGLGLRAAAVPVARIRAQGHDLRVRKMRLNGSNYLAMFSGGGIDFADQVLKGTDREDPAILRADADEAPPDLEGLSCRWEPLAASHGRMIALMVRPVGQEDEALVYAEVVARLRAILDENIRAHAPASDATLRFRWPPRGLAVEARALALSLGRAKAWGWALMTSAFQKWCHLRGAKAGDYDAPRYLEELKTQTDFRKYDGCLRTVLDCSQAQLEAIEAYLGDQHRAGRLVYGLHVDRSALMTCLVFNLKQGEHVHFVDAAGGGFARAAVGFKAQLAARGA